MSDEEHLETSNGDLADSGQQADSNPEDEPAGPGKIIWLIILVGIIILFSGKFFGIPLNLNSTEPDSPVSQSSSELTFDEPELPENKNQPDGAD